MTITKLNDTAVMADGKVYEVIDGTVRVIGYSFDGQTEVPRATSARMTALVLEALEA